VCDSVLPPTVVHARAKSLHVLIISLQELQARVAEHADQRRSRKCSWTAARGICGEWMRIRHRSRLG
jgi:hypothetical protein